MQRPAQLQGEDPNGERKRAEEADAELPFERKYCDGRGKVSRIIDWVEERVQPDRVQEGYVRYIEIEENNNKGRFISYKAKLANICNTGIPDACAITK